MNEKKRKEKKQQQLKPHESSLRNVLSQQVHDLRDRNLATKGASPKQAELTFKGSNILQCLCNATIQEKKKEKGNSWNVERLTQQQKKVLGVHSACTKTMPGPAIEIDDLWSIATCQARKKGNPWWFLPVFQATSPTRRRRTFGVHTKGSLAQTSTVSNRESSTGRGLALMLPTQSIHSSPWPRLGRGSASVPHLWLSQPVAILMNRHHSASRLFSQSWCNVFAFKNPHPSADELLTSFTHQSVIWSGCDRVQR